MDIWVNVLPVSKALMRNPDKISGDLASPFIFVAIVNGLKYLPVSGFVVTGLKRTCRWFRGNAN